MSYNTAGVGLASSGDARAEDNDVQVQVNVITLEGVLGAEGKQSSPFGETRTNPYTYTETTSNISNLHGCLMARQRVRGSLGCGADEVQEPKTRVSHVKKKRHGSGSKHRVSSSDSGESISVATRVRARHHVVEAHQAGLVLSKSSRDLPFGSR